MANELFVLKKYENSQKTLLYDNTIIKQIILICSKGI